MERRDVVGIQHDQAQTVEEREVFVFRDRGGTRRSPYEPDEEGYGNDE
jgi:uncharacterized sporulation protein YeaH/YhbH (DUF444 family)